jgi:DNA gyrase subunit A
MHIDTIRTMGRAAQGVKLISLKGNAEIAAIARVPRSEDEDEDAEVIDADNNGDELSNDGMNIDEPDADSTDDLTDNE